MPTDRASIGTLTELPISTDLTCAGMSSRPFDGVHVGKIIGSDRIKR